MLETFSMANKIKYRIFCLVGWSGIDRKAQSCVLWWPGHIIIFASSRHKRKWLRGSVQEGSRWPHQLLLKAGLGPHLPDVPAQTGCFSLAYFLLHVWPSIHFSTTLLRKEKMLSPGGKGGEYTLYLPQSITVLHRLLFSASSGSLINGHGDAEQEAHTRTFQSSRVFSKGNDH